MLHMWHINPSYLYIHVKGIYFIFSSRLRNMKKSATSATRTFFSPASDMKKVVHPTDSTLIQAIFMYHIAIPMWYICPFPCTPVYNPHPHRAIARCTLDP